MVKGKKYKLNLSKICRKKSKKDAADQIKKSKSYFCSELVASALKRVQLLDEHKSASQYWPGDFSKEKKVELKQGAWLGEEYLIDFSL